MDQILSGACILRDDGDTRVAFVCGIPVAQYPLGDRQAEALFVAQAAEAGWATTVDLARGVGLDRVTVFRLKKRLAAGGASAMTARKPGPKGPRLGAAAIRSIHRWTADGLGIAEIARKLGVSRTPVRNVLRRTGTIEAPVQTVDLASLDGTFRLGPSWYLLASTRDGSRQAVSGHALLVPPLRFLGWRRARERVFGSLGAEGGVVWSALAGLMGAAVIGTDTPQARSDACRQVRTLLAADPAGHFVNVLTAYRLGSRKAALAYAFVGSQVLVFPEGTDPGPADFARQALAAPVIGEAWLGRSDAAALVVTHDLDSETLATLPALVRHVQAHADGRRVTVVFDCGGGSPRLLQDLHAAGADLLTFRVGPWNQSPSDDGPLGRKGVVTPRWVLRETGATIGGGLRMRAVTLGSGARRASVLTTLGDVPALELAALITERWQLGDYMRHVVGPQPGDDGHRGAPGRRCPCDGLQDPDGSPCTCASSCRRLVGAVRMAAYQAERDLAALLVPRVARSRDEGRTLIRPLLLHPGTASLGDGEVILSFPATGESRLDQALDALCDGLDGTATQNGETERLRYRFIG